MSSTSLDSVTHSPNRRKIHRRTRDGCLTCRARRKKCDGRKPQCANCVRVGRVCIGSGFATDVPKMPFMRGKRSSPPKVLRRTRSDTESFKPILPRPVSQESAEILSDGESRNGSPSAERLACDRSRCARLLAAFNGKGTLCELSPQATEGGVEELGNLISKPQGHVSIEPPFHTIFGYNIRFGSNVRVADSCMIQDWRPVEIHDNVVIDHGVAILSRTESMSYEKRRSYICTYQSVVIEEDVWLGPRSIIMPGVRIGKRSVIAAGAIISKDVPQDSFVLAFPTKIQGYHGGIVSID